MLQHCVLWVLVQLATDSKHLFFTLHNPIHACMLHLFGALALCKRLAVMLTSG